MGCSHEAASADVTALMVITAMMFVYSQRWKEVKGVNEGDGGTGVQGCWGGGSEWAQCAGPTVRPDGGRTR